MARSAQFVLSELLVMRCQSGDEEALGQLVDLWQPLLSRRARQLCDTEEQASELGQDCWLAISRGIRSLRDPAGFPAWALHILRNLAADAVHRRQRERGSVERLSEETSSQAGSPDGELDSMRIAIRTLPDELREPLLLHYHEGYALSEVGRLLGLPAGTVKSRLFAARKMLRGMLKED
ncbi:MAG: sigma-70 family RNA polymerase sigma factor [Planctomycetales bacterium]|nr:sigma-70 family RNA polymerase sigma factor [bacterium]UNM09190.1 MAG: sigma-70 family RNA polymerase sigma factor [Planctomycetales bacterium]